MPDQKPFDVEGARKSGYSDDEIARYLASSRGFDVDGAVKSGYSVQDIIKHLSTATTATEPKGLGIMGNLTSAAKETWNQVKNFAIGLTSRPTMTYDPVTSAISGREGPGPIGALADVVNQNFFQPRKRSLPHRLVNTANALLGGDVAKAEEYHAAGDTGGEWAARLTGPVIGFGMGKLMGAPRRPALPNRSAVNVAGSLVDRSAVRPGYDPTRAQSASSLPLPNNVDVLTGISTLTQPLRQQALAELGITKSAFATTDVLTPQTDLMGRVKTGGKTILDVENQVVDIAHRPANTAINVYGDRPIPDVKSAVMSDLRAAAKNYADLDPALARAIEGVADNVESIGGTVRGLNTVKVHANKEMDKLLSASQGQQIAASAQAGYAYHIVANSIREHLYPELTRLGAPDMPAFGARESAAIMERNGVAKTYFSRVAPEQAKRSAMDYLTYVVEGSLYKTHVLRRAARVEDMPMAKFNRAFRSGIGEYGPDATPESISLSVNQPNLVNRALPPAPDNPPYTFSMPTGVSRIIQRSSTYDPTSTTSPLTPVDYLGPREVPYTSYPGHDPIRPTPPAEGTSWFRQSQQLGPLAEVIPNRVRGYRSSSKFREDQLGSSQAAIPERSFTGPKTQTESNWQLAPPETGTALTHTSGDAGQLLTSDPAVVTRTIADISDILGDPNLPTGVRSQLTAAYDNLMAQMKTFVTYSKLTPPPSVRINVTPYNPGTVPILPGKIRYPVAAAYTATQSNKKK